MKFTASTLGKGIRQTLNPFRGRLLEEEAADETLQVIREPENPDDCAIE